MELQKTTHLSSEPDLLKLLLCLLDYIQKHGESGKPFDVLRGLTTLTMERLNKGEELKISSTSLQVEVEGRIVADKSPGSALAGPWNKLTGRTLNNRKEGLQKFFTQHGLHHYLWPMKDKSSGGAGNTSMYYFEIQVIPTVGDIDTFESTTDTTEIRYIPEITPRPAWWLKGLLAGGYALIGWRRWLLIGVGLTSFLVVGVFVLLTFLVLVYSKSLTLQVVLSLVLSTSLVAWIGYILTTPIVKLLDWRIIKAPDILVSFSENNVLIELVKEKQASGTPTKIIRLVRYAGTCPICFNKVEVVDGKKEFPNRFVGRCEECPAEHVYSFDRITLRGKSLR